MTTHDILAKIESMDGVQPTLAHAGQSAAAPGVLALLRRGKTSKRGYSLHGHLVQGHLKTRNKWA